MDPAALSALAAAVGTGLIEAMTSDGWNTVRDRLAKIIGRESANREKYLTRQLEASRARIQTGRATADRVPIAKWEAEEWTRRLYNALENDSGLAAELQGVLVLIKQAAEPTRSNVTQHIVAQRDAYTAGGDQHIQIHAHHDYER